jgi:hypothetical protein
MERKKFLAGLTALVMSLAFSVGSASADVTQGDLAQTKLIPYFMAGDGLATIVGVQLFAVPDEQANPDLKQDKHLIDVSVYPPTGPDAKGMPMAAGTLCLDHHGFGAVVLQQEEGESTDTELRIAVGEGEGYAVVSYFATKIGCAASRLDPPDTTPNPFRVAATGAIEQVNSVDRVAVNKFATWTVLQDIEGGAFGTNIPSATVDMESRMSTGDPTTAEPMGRVAVTATNATAPAGQVLSEPLVAVGTITCNDSGMSMDAAGVVTAVTGTDPDAGGSPPCGLEQWAAMPAGPVDVNRDAKMNRADTVGKVAVRFDVDEANDSETTIYIWVPTTDAGRAVARGPYSAALFCEGDGPAEATNVTAMVSLPDMVNVINPVDLMAEMDDPCEARGMLVIDLAFAGATFGAVPTQTEALIWSHIAQEGGGYRMNFLGQRKQ